MKQHDDFWGDEADWPSTPDDDSTGRVPRVGHHEHVGPGGTLRRWWTSMIGAPTTATRTHGLGGESGGHTSDTATGDLDEFAAPAESRQAERLTDTTAASDDTWDDGWDIAPAPVPTGGVDPLLAKFGGLAVVLTLLVPVILSVGSGSDEQLVDAAAAAVGAPTSTEVSAPEAVPATIVVASSDSTVTTVAGTASTPTEPSTSTSATEAPTSSEAATATATAADTTTGALRSSSALADAGDIAQPAQAEEQARRVEPVCAIEYEVVAGDYWIRLADASHTPLADLLAVNGASSSTPMYPGSTICLPEGAQRPSPPTTAAPTTAAPTAAPTTAAPTTAAPTTAAPTTAVSGSVEQIIRDIWPDELEDYALQVAWRESNYVPTAKNYCCYGLFQIYYSVHKSWLAGMGITSAQQLFDPATNARAAYALYQGSGWGPWGG